MEPPTERQVWPLTRAVACCGVVVGLGWWLLKRYGRPQPGIKAVVKNPFAGFPFFETVSHALLQIITVGLGSPLGPLAAGVIIGVSEAVTMAFLSPSWAPIVSFSLLIALLLLRPGRT